ncbi:hypothetical protein LRS10_13810 [Phenylobacterium sp. J426]|uniref:HK97-gp10 family putative phage morphogenesis protein n=1 Tax=Phenylobacterium sp. J426 TaxID=2898439 RepID=UPI002150FB7B|nr:HK97-gp10 family putative phage morphogenesis protein [Phenylobacterium sp. J426]MCR5875169.1 hypothetical protein [Phenylobacterium sp. J426]
MKVKVRVEGLRDLDAALAELNKATARNVLQRALLKAADPVHQEAVRLAPERSGVLKSKIRKSTRKPKGHQSKAAFAAAMKRGATRREAVAAQRAFNRENPARFAEVFVGVEEGVAQAWPQELGTAKHPPQPYIRPAMEAKWGEALEIMKAEVRPEIEKAAERARKRALKKAAKG